MKRFLSAIIMLVYFVVSSGFAVSTHYCMDKISSIEWGATDSNHCNKCGMEKSASHGCCRDEVKVVQLHQDSAPAQYNLVDFSTALALLPLQKFLVLPFFNFTDVAIEKQHHPPLLSAQYNYITFRVFRI